MLLDRIELKPEYRGFGIGPAAVTQIIKTLGSSCDVIVCKPFPLQFAGAWQEEREAPDFEERLDAAREKIASIWKGVGFVRVRGTEYLVWPE